MCKFDLVCIADMKMSLPYMNLIESMKTVRNHLTAFRNVSHIVAKGTNRYVINDFDDGKDTKSHK